jgi:hypothetical protein
MSHRCRSNNVESVTVAQLGTTTMKTFDNALADVFCDAASGDAANAQAHV